MKPFSILSVSLLLLATLYNVSCGPITAKPPRQAVIDAFRQNKNAITERWSQKSVSPDVPTTDVPLATTPEQNLTDPIFAGSVPYYCNPLRYPPNIIYAARDCRPFLNRTVYDSFAPRRFRGHIQEGPRYPAKRFFNYGSYHDRFSDDDDDRFNRRHNGRWRGHHRNKR